MVGYFILFFYIRWRISRESIKVYTRAENNENSADIEEKTKSLKVTLINYAEGFLWYSMRITGTIPSHHIRNFIYRFIYKVNFDKTSVIYNGTEIRDPFKLKIGKGSIIGNKAILDARRGGITIGENVNLSTGVWLWTGQHDYQDPYFRSVEGKRGPIVIHDRVWIGPRVTVLHSVTIGEGAVIAAGSLVNKDVEPYSLYAGIPAKKIGERNKNLLYEFDGSYIPFY